MKSSQITFQIYIGQYTRTDNPEKSIGGHRCGEIRLRGGFPTGGHRWSTDGPSVENSKISKVERSTFLATECWYTKDLETIFATLMHQRLTKWEIYKDWF